MDLPLPFSMNCLVNGVGTDTGPSEWGRKRKDGQFLMEEVIPGNLLTNLTDLLSRHMRGW
jgi:hypothetical protein